MTETDEKRYVIEEMAASFRSPITLRYETTHPWAHSH